MTKIKKSKKIVITYLENGDVYKVFDGGTSEASAFFEKSVPMIYRHCSKPRQLYRYNGLNLRFESKLRDKIPGESEDEIRRRLGLSPYGAWRNDDWIYTMVDRVNAMLEKDKHKYYDPENRAYERRKKRDLEGEYVDSQIDTRNLEL